MWRLARGPGTFLDIELGDAVVIRNIGERVTQGVVQKIAAIALIVAKIDGDEPGPFELVIMQHVEKNCLPKRMLGQGR